MATDPETQTGLVVADYGRRGALENAAGDMVRYIVKGRKLRVVCGDEVRWVVDAGEGTAIITEILPRKNALERHPPANTSTVEILAANLSCLVVVCAPLPEPDWFLIDRYVCAGELMGCNIVVAANKIDMQEKNEPDLGCYVDLGYNCLLTSAVTKSGLNKLREALAGQTGILVGQSGVGKSSLVNALCPQANSVVRTLSSSTAEGRHTTTSSTMLQLPDGARLIDTPGVREFIPAFREPTAVQFGFREIRQAAEHCRFSNCQHLREPNCAVKDAVNDGSILQRRYDSYKRVINSL